MALSLGHKAIVESLLKRDADPNLVNAEGSTPLHVVCQRKVDDDLMKLFFKIIGDVRKTVQVDVRDNEGRTPLQWAVANILPNVVDLLLERGADLSTFVFPTEAHFAECFDARSTELAFKLRLACGLMEVVERLKKRGYELDRSDATTIMKLFSRYELFQRPWTDRSWYRDQVAFTSRAKQMLVDGEPHLSLHDMIQLPTKEALTIVASYMYYYAEFALLEGESLARHNDWALFVCEKLSKKFFRRWALYPFQELIHYRLPEEICEIIIENLSNEDLYSICLAVTD
uniref:Uncharacterized protein n=1 Tax=Trichogramma kaykai TaxID=54128 RepID=A0ABD2VWF2_9HYME